MIDQYLGRVDRLFANHFAQKIYARRYLGYCLKGGEEPKPQHLTKGEAKVVRQAIDRVLNPKEEKEQV